MADRSGTRVARRASLQVGSAVGLVAALARTVAAHGGSLGGSTLDTTAEPAWLVLATGGAVVGVSVLLFRVAAGRGVALSFHPERRRIQVPGRTVLVRGGQLLGVAVLVGVVAVGFAGPAEPLSNPAVMIVWVGWWAGFAISTYLVGNAWPVVNPWRTLGSAFSRIGRTYAWRWGAWPSVAGLLALVWLEVVGPLADRPRVLATTVVTYSAVTVAGSVVYGTDTWFRTVDPVARVFRYYGAVAPFGTAGVGSSGDDGDSSPRDDHGALVVRIPGARLTADVLDGLDEVAFVVALLWVTTFDGLVTTPAWRSVARAVVGGGVPPALVYPAALVGGFALYLWVFLTAAKLAARVTATDVTAPVLARRFGSPLLAVAAGVHLAHFLAYFLQLLPPLGRSVAAPFASGDPSVLMVPDWFGLVGVAGLFVGHVVAVLAASAVAVEEDSDRSGAVRTLSPFVVAMVCYTVVSLWVVTRPDAIPPYV